MPSNVDCTGVFHPFFRLSLAVGFRLKFPTEIPFWLPLVVGRFRLMDWVNSRNQRGSSATREILRYLRPFGFFSKGDIQRN